jgi:hypothetical protein
MVLTNPDLLYYISNKYGITIIHGAVPKVIGAAPLREKGEM